MPPELPPDIFFLSQLCNYWQIFALKAACEMDLADQFNDGPRSAADVASALGRDPGALFRLLRALTDCGVFAQVSDGVFAHTERSQLLRSDLPQSFKWMVLSEFGEERVPAWMNLPGAIRSGGIAFDEVYGGKDVWAWYREHPAQGEYFYRWMTGGSHAMTQAIHAAFDFSPYKSVVDVGGGQGVFLGSILDRNPEASGTLYDLPQVIATVQPRERMTLVAGDAFQSVPEGGDLYTLKWVIHDWDDEKSLSILRNCRRAMSPSSKLLVVEALIAENKTAPGPDVARWMDINMLVMTGGRERTEAEYGALLAKAGFSLERVVPTGSMPNLLLATPA